MASKNNSIDPIQKQVTFLRERGNNHFKINEFEDAIQCYTLGLKLNPNDAVLHCNLSQAYLKVNMYSDAFTAAEKSLSIDDTNEKAYFRASKALIAMGNPNVAANYLTKGLNKCKSSNTEELQQLLYSLSKEQMTKKNAARGNIHEKLNQKEVQKNIKKGPISKEDLAEDTFITTLQNIADEVGSTALAKIETTKKEALMNMEIGSEYMLQKNSVQAMKSYSVALKILDNEYLAFEMGIMAKEFYVLKYSLTLSWIYIGEFDLLLQALKNLKEIEMKKLPFAFPAIYYGYGKALIKLNRFQEAQTFLDKGMEIAKKKKLAKICWPGLKKQMKESNKDRIQEMISALIDICKNTHTSPDAKCKYNQCLTLSTHPYPSNFIYYSDPDYNGIIIIMCESNCRIEYHKKCWKNIKENICSVKKLTDKDFIGYHCLTKDCVNKNGTPSIIIKILILGPNGVVQSKWEIPSEGSKKKKARGQLIPSLESSPGPSQKAETNLKRVSTPMKNLCNTCNCKKRNVSEGKENISEGNSDINESKEVEKIKSENNSLQSKIKELELHLEELNAQLTRANNKNHETNILTQNIKSTYELKIDDLQRQLTNSKSKNTTLQKQNADLEKCSKNIKKKLAKSNLDMQKHLKTNLIESSLKTCLEMIEFLNSLSPLSSDFDYLLKISEILSHWTLLADSLDIHQQNLQTAYNQMLDKIKNNPDGANLLEVQPPNLPENSLSEISKMIQSIIKNNRGRFPNTSQARNSRRGPNSQNNTPSSNSTSEDERRIRLIEPHTQTSLIALLKTRFPQQSEQELITCIDKIVENNINISSFTAGEILNLFSQVIQQNIFKSNATCAGASWSTNNEFYNWQNPEEEEIEECAICIEALIENITVLECKHSYHTDCIRKSLKINSLCPQCRRYTNLDQEFPALSLQF